MRIIFTLLLLIGAVSHLSGQFYISGNIQDGIYGDPVPFCEIIVDDSLSLLSDGLGMFQISSTSQISKLTFNAPFHKELEYKVFSDSIDLNIRLIAYTVFLPLRKSDESVLGIIKNYLASNSKKYDREFKLLQFERNSYEILKSNDIKRFKRNFNSYLGLFGQRLNHYPNDHYLIYNSSHDLIEYKNKYNFEEKTISRKSIGIQNSFEFTGANYLYEISIYNNFWRIGSVYYPNPLSGETQKRYLFRSTDTVQLANSELLVIQFSPKLKNEANKLRGFIYFDKTNNRVHAVWAEKAVDTDSKLRISAEYQNFNGVNVIESSHLVQNLTGIQSFSTQIKLLSSVKYSSYQFNSQLQSKYYDEIIKTYSNVSDFHADHSSPENDSLIKNTQEFYSANPQLESVYRGLNFGKELYQGKIPIGGYELNIHDIIAYNNHEGIRLGLGIQTKQKLSKRFKTRAFLAYGFRDEEIKFGASEKIYLDRNYWNWIKVYGRKDVFESGSVDFPMQESDMFRSELLRRYGISIMDNEVAIGIGSKVRLTKYLQSQFGIDYSILEPTYDYVFQNDSAVDFRYTEVKFGLRFAFGEQRIRWGRNHYLVNNPFPEFYIQWKRGLKTLGSDFNYNKYEFRINYQKHILGFGKSSIQINTGFADRSLPYHKLYVGRGGLRNLSVVFHNTFETMAFNEFLSDRYFYLFYSHNFGPLFFSFLNHYPSLEMLHNFGIGDLNHPADHGLIGFNIMNKGYLESGLFVNDILIINTAGLKTGLGTGFFYRYGAYQNPDLIKNIVLKVSLNLDL
ncbi:hypothetical protein HZR84_02375 [Hyphobacterium sp. CCMP332]|nr:hypothetical protein HZR84_02375 [Hyphobacterium sp. CCMP332]